MKNLPSFLQCLSTKLAAFFITQTDESERTRRLLLWGTLQQGPERKKTPFW